MNTILHHPVLIGLGIYYLITMFLYWLFMLRGFQPSGVKTLDIIARVAMLFAPVLIPFALIKALISLAKGK
jgi:hypothetical protein